MLPMSSDTFWRYATLLPAIVLFAVLTILPLANLLALSFNDVEWLNRKAVWDWVGLDNYAALPEDNLLRAGLLNTLIFAVVAVALQMLIGFVLALLTTQITRGRTFYRTVFILPILVPGIIIGAIWKLMYSYDFGVINAALTAMGLAPQDWLGNPNLALLSVIIVDVWHWTPFCFLLLLAGLESLPDDIFEAARIDGATRWQILRHITLPLMLPTLVVTFVFRMILAFKVFDEIYLLTGGGPGTATEVISFTIYRRFFTEDQTGYGAAMSIAVIAVIAAMIIAGTRATAGKGAKS
jgi:multiple sugar transport system permease protein